jgi:hypothetical protein
MTHTDLLMIVPSRGRPQSVALLAQAWTDTGKPRRSCCCASTTDDHTMPQYVDACEQHGVEILIGPTAASRADAERGRHPLLRLLDALGFMRRRPPPAHLLAGTERMLAELDRLGHGIVYGNDLIHGPNLPTAVVMSASIVQTVGYMCPPGLVHLMLDNFWKAAGEGAGCLSYLPDVIIEHMHPLVGKAPDDPGYQEVNADSMYAADGATYQRYVDSGGLAADVEKIRSLRG